MKNSQWRLKSRPTGPLALSNFERVEAEVPSPQEGEVLVRSLYFAFEASMRGWVEDVKTYMNPVQLVDVMIGPSVVQVIESRHEGFEEGDILLGGAFGWQEYAVSKCEPTYLGEVRKLPRDTDPKLELGVFGWAGLSAYFGLLDVGGMHQGDTVLVSAAAGATGSIAVQLARIHGAAKVVGLAGGPEKCRWLVEEIGCDAAVDYKAGDIVAQLKPHFPKGIDLFFDNVGGDILDTVLLRMAVKGRIVTCGAIATYDRDNVLSGHGAGLRNFLQVIPRGLTIKGFLVFDYMHRAQEARAEMQKWIDRGELKVKIDLVEGFDNIPSGLLRLFSGGNLGKQLVKVADPL